MFTAKETYDAMRRCVVVSMYVDKRDRLGKTYSFVCASHKKRVRRENLLYLHDIPRGWDEYWSLLMRLDEMYNIAHREKKVH